MDWEHRSTQEMHQVLQGMQNTHQSYGRDRWSATILLFAIFVIITLNHIFCNSGQYEAVLISLLRTGSSYVQQVRSKPNSSLHQGKVSLSKHSAASTYTIVLSSCYFYLLFFWLSQLFCCITYKNTSIRLPTRSVKALIPICLEGTNSFHTF